MVGDLNHKRNGFTTYGDGQGETNVAMFSLFGAWLCCLGCSRGAERSSGKEKSYEIIDGADNDSPFATTVVSYMNAISDCLLGQRHFIYRIFLLGLDEPHLKVSVFHEPVD